MTEAETEAVVVQLGAEQLALRACVVQLIVDRMRDEEDKDAARQLLRRFDNDAQGLVVAVPPTEGNIGALVQMLAVERLAKLIETVRALFDQEL
jgi:hypothetical protein